MKSSSSAETPMSPQPAAAAFVRRHISQAVQQGPWLANFEQRLLNETGTRLFDWIDHVYVDAEASTVDELQSTGFEARPNGSTFDHPTAIFPRVIVSADLGQVVIGIKVESVADFLTAHEADTRSNAVSGSAVDQLQIAQVTFQDNTRVHFVERHGYQGFVPGNHEQMTCPEDTQQWLDEFRTRPRPYTDPQSGFDAALAMFQKAAKSVGRNRACDLFFRSEREFWESRNVAARVQRERQDKLGLGWANHDHHTYRCSRESFAPLIQFLETAGFFCRERFYAGKDAGWGAQVLEHRECGIVIFADVDLSEGEVSGDFAHDGLQPKADLGTVGLWCKLHGDSFLAAGMHHLECQFDFDAAREQLANAGIKSMQPFTNFPHLKQAFTVGERWMVPEDRLEKLAELSVISREDVARFISEGAIGSHLEILERNDGYKGFNQTGISDIILQTNPKNSV